MSICILKINTSYPMHNRSFWEVLKWFHFGSGDKSVKIKINAYMLSGYSAEAEIYKIFWKLKEVYQEQLDQY